MTFEQSLWSCIIPIPAGYNETIVTPQMSRSVEAQWSFRAEKNGCALVLPDGRCDIIFRFSIHDAAPPVPVITGPATETYEVPYVEGECWMGLRMRPECGAWVWGRKIKEAVDNVLRGQKAYDHLPQIRKFGNQLSLTGSYIELIKDVEGSAPDDRLCEAVKLIHVSGGRIRLDALARILQCSTRHLNRLFRANVGIGAKTYAQLVQFHRAVGLLRTQQISITDAALEAGYADHAHMTRTFRKFGRFVPSNVPSDLAQPGILA